VEYCCKEMEKAEEGKAIVFPTFPDEHPHTFIFGPHSSRIGPRSFEIHFCPFCSAKISFEVTK
jgi:hypothetical protein